MILLSSCKKGIGELVDNNTKIEFKLDGVTKKSSGKQSIQTYYGENEGYQTLMLNARVDNENISLVIWPFNGVGEYDIETDVVILYSIIEGPNEITLNSIGISGKLKITSFNQKKVEGQFESTLERVIVTPPSYRKITNGSFSCEVSPLSEAPESLIDTP